MIANSTMTIVRNWEQFHCMSTSCAHPHVLPWELGATCLRGSLPEHGTRTPPRLSRYTPLHSFQGTTNYRLCARNILQLHTHTQSYNNNEHAIFTHAHTRSRIHIYIRVHSNKHMSTLTHTPIQTYAHSHIDAHPLAQYSVCMHSQRDGGNTACVIQLSTPG